METLTTDDELYRLVSQGNSPDELDVRLKTLPNIDETLKLLYERDDQHVNLLMLAALHGHDTIVRIILSYASNVKKLVELTGKVTYDTDGNSFSNVTALWCACDRGHYVVARTLIETGRASVYHGPRYPLLIDAVIGDRLDTVRFLIENGYADVNRTTENHVPRYNSLMFAATFNRAEIIAYLLEQGARVNYTSRLSRNTALGCAATQGHLDMVRLLCSVGAYSHVKTSDGETPLILAFKKGHSDVVDYLLEFVHNEPCIEEVELIASSFILPVRNRTVDQSQFVKMVNLMRKIFKLRETRNSSKPITKPIVAYNFQQECQTIEEFDKIQNDHDRLCIEALLIQERILIPKKLTILCEPLLFLGERFVEQGRFELCLQLWEHTFHLYQIMEHDTSLHRFVWVFCRMLTANVSISPQQFLQICRLTCEPSQNNKNNHCIKNALCFVAIAVKVLEQPILTKTERQLIYQWVNDLCREQHVTSEGQTLLHLCVNDKTYRDINYRANDVKRILSFPNLAATQLLLICGSRWINTDAVDLADGNTALHIVSRSIKPDALPIIELLINAGAHMDCLNKQNQTPFNLAKSTEITTVLKKQQTPFQLKCLCARYIVSEQLNYELIWPAETKLNTFIFLHGCIAKQKYVN